MDDLTLSLASLSVKESAPAKAVVPASKPPKAAKEPKPPKAAKEPKPPKAAKEPKPPKEPKAPKAAKEPKPPKAAKAPKVPKSKGKAAVVNGIAYEKKIRTELATYRYNDIPLLLADTTAGAGHGHDVQFTVADMKVFIECKDKGAFEGGGKRFKNMEGVLKIPEDCIHKTLLGTYVPFGGKIPFFLKWGKPVADDAIAAAAVAAAVASAWADEKEQFSDEYIDLAPTTVANYYKAKGVHYIQVDTKGLYTTGLDILELGVPVFTCPTRLRIRCKIHSGKIPTSVQAGFVYNRRFLAASPFDIMKKLPTSFTKGLELTPAVI